MVPSNAGDATTGSGRAWLHYKTGFPVPQPHGDPIDLAQSDDELLTAAKALLFTKR
jgi:hypothetical protein